jgi:hypothetical protein
MVFETPRVTFYLWSPWRATALEHRLYAAVRKLPGIMTESEKNEEHINVSAESVWENAFQSLNRVLLGWQEEADAAEERRSWRWVLEGNRRFHVGQLRLPGVAVVDRDERDAGVQAFSDAAYAAFVASHPATAMDEEHHRRWLRRFRLVEIEHLTLVCAVWDVRERGFRQRFLGVLFGFRCGVAFFLLCSGNAPSTEDAQDHGKNRPAKFA